jgi:hypothetical protein
LIFCFFCIKAKEGKNKRGFGRLSHRQAQHDNARLKDKGLSPAKTDKAQRVKDKAKRRISLNVKRK